MLLLFPIITFCAICFFSTTIAKGLRKILIHAVVIWAVMLVIITEVLSLFNGITKTTLASAWIIMAIVFVVVALIIKMRKKTQKI